MVYHSSGISTGVNKKVIGMMKDEAGGRIITEKRMLFRKIFYLKITKIGYFPVKK